MAQLRVAQVALLVCLCFVSIQGFFTLSARVRRALGYGHLAASPAACGGKMFTPSLSPCRRYQVPSRSLLASEQQLATYFDEHELVRKRMNVNAVGLCACGLTERDFALGTAPETC